MRLVNLLSGVLLSATVAMAQGVPLPDPKAINPERSNAIQWLITAVFLVATLVVAFKPAKRSKLE